ncbi:MAG: DEAD/DEAH box helicase [Deltaproteobacteria bacterium]|nr:DEAD/DEAH box helicase [Deltaproteobacteria bacterium]MBW2100062.1 DEAD/DEAH box helicase [Deltaproteobacteria bacterium]
MSIPLHAKDQVLTAMAAISSSLTVHSSIGGASDDIAEKKGNTMPYVRMLPSGEGFRVEVVVKPLGEGGPHLKPGIGDKTIIARVAGKRIQTQRNLGIEEKMARAVETACPSLPIFDEIDRTGYLAEPEDCLQVLTELKKLQDDGRVIVEWPEGEKLKVVEEISFERLHMGIKSRNNWFEVSGELKADENLVLDMKKLLDLIGQTEHRFIPLDDGRFIALTEVFRRKLAELETLSHGRGKTVRFSPLSALLLEEFADNIPKLKSDKVWKEKVKRIRQGRELIPEVPSTFKGELRAYQVDGYSWLMRLAHWGVGACLADDMGLGKTVQALALMLARASEGPALVVAPTSVCSNWMDEAKRFAPTLNALLFGGSNRKEMIKNLKGFDLLVVSYTLLQQEVKLLTEVNWHTVVLDEAQAIKNITTRRSRAAMELNGDFRIITTGTPIENNLTEFWTLFNFVNPGLLGPLKRFNERFVLPIERDNSADARRRLKKMISPFILRRIKSQVLDDLPPRTDVILEVEMGREEKAFYEALRQEAVKKLEDDETPPGRKHFKILAEIMKLRRACCHPSLVMPECGLSGAKLDLFGNLVTELRENGHKALVFSQFVGHLNILRQYLEDQKIDYRYIDGSTPAKERKKQVDRFQAGEGDIFLISLKAGGLGLNLTAASYVIHMDPWWNPAVEDQASDRAYRIGQQQPVTVYRLVMRGAIEEKIVRLHAKKRDLADSLLAGTDMSGKISAEELLELIRER